MSDIDDLVNREYDENDQWLMEERQNTQDYDPTMNKAELRELEQRFRKFIEFVDLRDSRSIANARTLDWSTMLLGQHEKNKKVLQSCLSHIIAVKGSHDIK